MKSSVGVSLLALFVSACGGGGGEPGTSPLCTTDACKALQAPSPQAPKPSPSPAPSPGPAPAPAPAPAPVPSANNLEGFYVGTVNGTPSGNYTFGLVALENREVWGIYHRNGAIYGAFHGSVQTTGGAFTGSGFDYYLPTGSRTPGSFSGTYSAGASISGTIAAGGGAFTGVYDASYDVAATAAAIQGTWNGQSVSRAGLEGGSVTIGADGSFVGQVSACGYSGSVIPQASGKNVFDMTVTFAGSGCLFNSATLSGIALVSNGQLLTLALLPDGSDGFMALASRGPQ